MSIVPDTNIGKIEFYEAHIPVWTGSPGSVGLLPADCTALQTLIQNARKAYNDQQAAASASKAATTAMHNAVKAMHALGSSDIMKIKSYAEGPGGMDVYAKAQIPPPATPTPVGPPGTPTDFVVTLMQDGSVMLKWKCNNPSGASGTVYNVRRKIGSGAFEYLDSVGSKMFTDATIPSGSTGVTYEITASRSTVRGMPAQFNVNFGVGGDGVMFATVSEENAPAMKMAA
jgi:hypothetical protein